MKGCTESIPVSSPFRVFGFCFFPFICVYLEYPLPPPFCQSRRCYGKVFYSVPECNFRVAIRISWYQYSIALSLSSFFKGRANLSVNLSVLIYNSAPLGYISAPFPVIDMSMRMQEQPPHG